MKCVHPNVDVLLSGVDIFAGAKRHVGSSTSLDGGGGGRLEIVIFVHAVPLPVALATDLPWHGDWPTGWPVRPLLQLLTDREVIWLREREAVVTGLKQIATVFSGNQTLTKLPKNGEVNACSGTVLRNSRVGWLLLYKIVFVVNWLSHVRMHCSHPFCLCSAVVGRVVPECWVVSKIWFDSHLHETSQSDWHLNQSWSPTPWYFLKVKVEPLVL